MTPRSSETVKLCPSPAARPAPRLARAFTGARYILVAAPGQPRAMIGRHTMMLAAYLARHGYVSGVFITAWNPRGAHAAAGANVAGNARLAQYFRRSGIRYEKARHVARDPHWNEESFFVLGLGMAEALTLARRFGQAAVVEVARGKPARLHFT